MNPSLVRRLASGLTLVLLMAAEGCSGHSIIGQQTGQGGSMGTGGTGTGGLGTGGGEGGDVGTGGQGTGGQGTGGSIGTGGDGTGAGGTSCPLGAGGSSSTLSFGAPVEHLTNAGSFLVAVGDLNGDGKPDLAVANYSIPVSSTSGTGGNSGAGGSGTGGGFGANQGSVSVFLSSTAGYGAPQNYIVSPRPSSIAAGDLNGDGKADVAVVNSEGVSVYFSDGSGKLLSPVNFATGSGPVWVALGDLNGDGQADLAVANQGVSNGSAMVGGDVAILLNTGGGTFFARNYAAGASPVALAIGDLSVAGRPDLAVASGTGVSILFNNGAGAFGLGDSYGSGTNPLSVATGDLNGDGKIDIAVGQGANVVSVLLNIGNTSTLGPGTFAAAVNYTYADATFGNYPGPVAIGDVDGDGRPDLVRGALGSCVGVAVLPNQGSGVFGAPSFFPVAISGNPSSTTLADLNGDGKLDLVVANGDGVAVMLNTTP